MRAFLSRLSLIAALVLVPLHPLQVAAQTLTRAPELVQFVEAPYPEAELEARRSAVVALELTIAADGTVQDPAVTESAGAAFDAAALEAVRKFTFRPAEIDGQVAPIRIAYRYAFEPPPEPPKVAVFSGVVRAREGGAPLAGVTVKLASGASAITDDQGRFRIEGVAPGEQLVSLQGPSLALVQTSERFEAGQEVAADYAVELVAATPDASAPAEDLEIVVNAPLLRKQVVSTEVSAEQAKRVPGSQGDALRVVESLPGVARGALGSGQLIVWGSGPEDTRVYVDGVRVPRLYHNGGLRSILSSDLVEAVDLVPGGYGAAFGRALGGLITVQTVPLANDRVRGSVALDVLDAQGAIQIPIARGLSAAVALRRSHLAEVLEATADDDVEAYFTIPRYTDGQARLRYAWDEQHSIELTGLLSADELSRSSTNPDPSRNVQENREQDFERIYVSYRGRESDGSSVALTPFIGWERTNLSNSYGATETVIDQRSFLGGARASYRKPLSSWLTIEAGLDAEIARYQLQRQGSIGAPAREGDVRVFGQPPPDRISSDDWQVTSIGVAPYVEADVGLFDDALHVLPGLRIDPTFTNVSQRAPREAGQPPLGVATHRFAVEPRLSLRYAFSSAVSAKAAWGVYHQPPLPDDLSAVFGNPTLQSGVGMHWVAALNWQIGAGLSVELTGFYTSSEELAARSPVASPLVGQALTLEGHARSYGQQLLLRQEFGKRFFGWISYTLVRSERRVGEEEYRLSDYDQSHVFTALGTFDLGAGFQVGARVRYSTGFPRTAVIDAYYDVRRDVFQPVFGAHNAIRIPAFFQIDLRAEKAFRLGDTTLDLYIEVQNVSDHENAEEIVYDSDYTERDYITGLPILPVAGVKWTF